MRSGICEPGSWKRALLGRRGILGVVGLIGAVRWAEVERSWENAIDPRGLSEADRLWSRAA
eukprot:COSAG02_NODE_2846_length_7905_cov_14.993378_4_plen_61_part_00